MLARAVASLARRGHHSSAAPAQRIAELIARLRDHKDREAIVFPAHERDVLGNVQPEVRWSYGELIDRARVFATGLKDMGYGPGQRLGVKMYNSPELVVAMVGSALAGNDVETAKTAEDLLEVECRGTLVEIGDAEMAGGMIGTHEPIAVGGGDLSDPIVHWDVMMEAFKGQAPPDLPADSPGVGYYFSSPTRVATEQSLVKNGADAATALKMTADDRVCIAVPLTHNMGFGFGLMSTWHVGACAVMPALKPADVRLTDEEHGRNRAMNVTTTLLDEKCSLALADSHVLKSLPVFGYGKLPAGMEALRGGLTKVGSGDAIGLGEPKLWCEVPFTTVGRKPTK